MKAKSFPKSTKRLGRFPSRRGRKPAVEETKTGRIKISDEKAKQLNEQFHVLPKINKVYGIKYGSKKVLRILTEDEVVLVEYLDFKKIRNLEALVLFNRWAFKNQIPLP